MRTNYSFQVKRGVVESARAAKEIVTSGRMLVELGVAGFILGGLVYLVGAAAVGKSSHLTGRAVYEACSGDSQLASISRNGN